ncbi:MAG: glycosyltransferase family 39 protein, partial [Chloroflexota bacterium]
MRHQFYLTLILVTFLVLGVIYALVTPVFESSDELTHYPMVRHLADGNPLPVQDPQNVGPWKQEASQPPLYYYLAAALTFWIDASDMEQRLWLNPHVDSGVITPDGNVNLVIHDPTANPWQGTLLAVRLIRLASISMGAVTVYLTYQIAREVLPGRPEIALGAAAVNAFTPMFLYISGAVSNDNLVVPLASLALLLMIRVVRPEGGFGKNLAAETQRAQGALREQLRDLRASAVSLGIVIGLAILSKESALGLLPLAWGVLVIRAWQRSDGRLSLAAVFRWLWLGTVRWLGLVLLPAALIAGWWYFRNWQLYGDWLGWNAFIAVLGQRAHPASLAQLWGERWGFLLSYWGLFGGVNVPMPTWIYHVLNATLVAAVAGFVVYVMKVIRKWQVADGRWQVASSNYQLLITDHLALFFCLLWSAAVVVGLIRWATVTWSSQGRLVFTAISALDTLLVVGLVGWLPRRPATIVVSIMGGFLLVVAAVAPFAWIRPAYQPPQYTMPNGSRAIDLNFSQQMRLTQFSLEPATARPGDTVEVTLAWEVLAAMERDWSIFVHLNDPVLGAPISQRDMYPGQGLLATRLLRPGQNLVTKHVLTLPVTAVAPAELELAVGLYNYYTNKRLPITDDGDAATLAKLTLTPIPGQFPNPLAVNFEGELELVGYELKSRRLSPGDTLALVLYWRALRPLSTDYTFFAQVVDKDTTRWASHDLSPQ